MTTIIVHPDPSVLPDAHTAPSENFPLPPPDGSVLSLVDFRYTVGTCAANFYHRYRDHVRACLGKKGERLADGEVLSEDERLGPAGEDLVLLNVLGLIDSRLPAHVRDVYSHRLKNSSRLLDFR